MKSRRKGQLSFFLLSVFTLGSAQGYSMELELNHGPPPQATYMTVLCVFLFLDFGIFGLVWLGLVLVLDHS